MHKTFYLTILYTVVALVACSPTDTPNPAVAETATEASVSATLALAEGHFHPKGKAPSEQTRAVLKQAREGLPFSDRLDFEEDAELRLIGTSFNSQTLRRVRVCSNPLSS